MLQKLGRDQCKLTKIVKMTYLLSLNIKDNRHPNNFLKLASRTQKMGRDQCMIKC